MFANWENKKQNKTNKKKLHVIRKIPLVHSEKDSCVKARISPRGEASEMIVMHKIEMLKRPRSAAPGPGHQAILLIPINSLWSQDMENAQKERL